MLDKRLIELGERMLDELYKASVPSLSWKEVEKKYRNSSVSFYYNHYLSQEKSEQILDKYMSKCKNKSETDSLDWLWLNFAPSSKLHNPGSSKAVQQGCTCPVLDNCRGDDKIGKTRGFYITEGCPLHDKQK